MEPQVRSAESRARAAQSPDYLCIDFGRCNAFEISEMSRRFTDLCMGRHVGRAMLKAGDNDPAGHHGLRDALLAMAGSAQLRLDFKLALVPSTPPIRAIYEEAQRALRAIGCNACVFDDAAEAAEWLEGRAVAGRAAS
jgi:hypothetical protein